MQYLWQRFFDWGLMLTVKPVMRSNLIALSAKRKLMELLAVTNPITRDLIHEDFTLGDCLIKTAAPHDLPDKHKQKVILYAHGGAFVLCSYKTHQALVTYLAQKTQSKVYFPEYALAPESVYPKQTDQLLEVYKYLLDMGYQSKNITLMGDSAGASLAASLLAQINTAGLDKPSSLVLISPWLDISCSDRDTVSDRRDRMLTWKGLLRDGLAYSGETRSTEPLISPLNLSNAQLKQFPPTLIHSGSNEIINAQAERFKIRLLAQRVPCTHEIFDDMWHNFQLHASLLKQSRDSFNKIDAFIKHARTQTLTTIDDTEQQTPQFGTEDLRTIIESSLENEAQVYAQRSVVKQNSSGVEELQSADSNAPS